ncbi:MAG: isoleucine--tRNA ligase [Deltaproteobacteria bacterium]|jgi:isoleucyl-tRNA synthetase|nr:isoleucine--tRNA ligase [Deltaproteobacteria bacterium]
MDHKNSLNLPKTDFPMKAGLTTLEPKILARWQEMNLYRRILERGRSRPTWTLHDGPPYANGHIHTGTALNKILKDIIIKAKTMSGFHSPYVPGWDCHGLPIEHQVDKDLGAKKKDLSRSEIRARCRAYAEKFIKIQSEEFQRLGVLGDWDEPYLTMNYEYEARIARELGRAALDGRLQRSLKPVLWCGSCRTALAEAEVEYADVKSEAIYVGLPALTDPAALSPALAGERVELLIWTTTPWTIPANRGVAYNPEFEYRAWRLRGRTLVLAAALAPSLWPKLGDETPEDLGPVPTGALSGFLCRHPLYDRESKVVPAAYVTAEQGTGLVHTAPGHGREDYETGLAHDLEIFSPLDDEARYTAEVPELAGRRVLEANGAVVEQLKARGALWAAERIDHQYPHCWRCKKPVVFRSTPQWFILMEVGNLRAKTLKAIDEVSWVPRWGRDRIHGMIENRPDWCVSRQRSWGVPITVFFCRDCGRWHYSEAVMERLYDLFKAEGADAWYDRPTEELLPADEKCAGCGGRAFDKETDILDVWFDSGCSFAAVCEAREDLPDVADLYLEGSDQHRGWFHSSLLISMANRGRPPYREVLTHGYVVDGAGHKMSKSVGNVVEPAEVIRQHGADVLRLWVAAENYQDDVRISSTILEMLKKAYFSFRNTARFILGNIHDFDPSVDAVPWEQLGPLDRHVLHQLETLRDKVTQAYDRYEFHDVYQLINRFVVFLSSLYHDVVKDRLYTFKSSHPKRRAAQTVMRTTLSTLTRLTAPVLSFTCEEIWSRLAPGENSSVFLQDFPAERPEFLQPESAAEMERLLALRSVANKALEQARQERLIGGPLDAEVTLTASGEDHALLVRHQADLAELLIVSDAKVEPGPDGSEPRAVVVPSPHPKCPRCWIRSPEVPADQTGVCLKCRAALS